MTQLISESCVVKNMRLNHLGFSPYQWVLGKLPLHALTDAFWASMKTSWSLRMSLHNNFRFAWQPRKLSQKWIQAAESEQLCFQGTIFTCVTLFVFIAEDDGTVPGRIVGREGRAAVWVVHGGVPLVVPESSLRPASSSEIFEIASFTQATQRSSFGFKLSGACSLWR